MGAIERNGYQFQAEYSTVNQDGAIHVYKNGEFIEEISFEFQGAFPNHNLIEELVNHYCFEHGI